MLVDYGASSRKRWLPKRDKLDPVQASARDFAVAQEGKKKVEKVGGGGDAMAGTGKSVVLAWRNDGII